MTYERENFKYKVHEFMKATAELVNAWWMLDGAAEDSVSVKYPFEASFDEVESSVRVWYESVCKELAKLSTEEGLIKYVEYEYNDNIKFFCAFNFDDSMTYASVTCAEYHADDNEWFCYTCESQCCYDFLSSKQYLDKFFERNETNGCSSGGYDSLEELIVSETIDGNDVSLLSHFLRKNK